MAKSFSFPCHCHSRCWSVSSVGPSKPQKNRLPRQGFLGSSCFLLPVLVPSCFESLFQLQPGKRHALQHGLAMSAETIICGWNQHAVIGKCGYKSPCKCWGDVTQYFDSRRGDPGALVSLCFLCSFGLCKSFSFYTPFHPFSFFSGWLLERPSIFLWSHWLCFPDSNPSVRPCRSDIKKITILRPLFFPAHWCPLCLNCSV